MAEFRYRGKMLAEIEKMDLKQFAEVVPSRQRRSIKRGSLQSYKPLLSKIKLAKEGRYKKIIKTHARDMIVLPDMLGMTLHIHTGKAFVPIKIAPEMLGMYLGELTTTRQKVQHSAPGIGATKSSTAIASKAK